MTVLHPDRRVDFKCLPRHNTVKIHFSTQTSPFNLLLATSLHSHRNKRLLQEEYRAKSYILFKSFPPPEHGPPCEAISLAPDDKHKWLGHAQTDQKNIGSWHLSLFIILRAEEICDVSPFPVWDCVKCLLLSMWRYWRCCCHHHIWTHGQGEPVPSQSMSQDTS